MANGLLIGGADVQVTDPTVNDNGLFSNSPAGILSGFWRPGNEALSATSQNLNDLTTGQVSMVNGYQENLTLSDAALTDYSSQANSYVNIDPLVLGLNGNSISLSNWIDNAVYFQSNVTFNPTTGQATSDGKLHHTSWINAGDGMLVLPVSGAVPDITDTVSQYFRGGQFNATTGTYTPWTDGLAALASLASAGASTFSAATSLTDPATGQRYWAAIAGRRLNRKLAFPSYNQPPAPPGAPQRAHRHHMPRSGRLPRRHSPAAGGQLHRPRPGGVPARRAGAGRLAPHPPPRRPAALALHHHAAARRTGRPRHNRRNHPTGHPAPPAPRARPAHHLADHA